MSSLNKITKNPKGESSASRASSSLLSGESSAFRASPSLPSGESSDSRASSSLPSGESSVFRASSSLASGESSYTGTSPLLKMESSRNGASISYHSKEGSTQGVSLIPNPTSEGSSAHGAPSKPASSGVAKPSVRPHKRRNRTGAARKRARQTWTERTTLGGTPAETGSKRGRPEGETPPSTSKPTKRARPDLTYSQVAGKGVKVAVAAAGFPAMQLSADLTANLQEALDYRMDGLPDGGPLPVFDGFKLNEQGVVQLFCGNDMSLIWLREAIGDVSPLNGVELQLLEGDALPKYRKMVATVPGKPADQATILKRIKRHNPELRTELWKVRDAQIIEAKGLRLILGVDEASAVKLESLGYRAQAGMVKVVFWDPKHSREDAGPSGGGDTEPDTAATAMEGLSVTD